MDPTCERIALASGYVWGRQDMGDRRCTDAITFGMAYAARFALFDKQEIHHMPSVQDAYECWVRENRIN